MLAHTRRPRSRVPAAFVVLGLMTLVAAGPLAGDALGQAGRLAGQVMDQDGEPVAGITVQVRNPDRAVDLELQTDEDGRFARAGLEPGTTYELIIDAPGYLPVRQQVRVSATSSEVRIRLQGGAPYAEARYQQGYQAYERRDFEAAATAMTDVADALEESDEPGQMYRDALVLLGFSRGQLGEMEAAEDAYQNLIEAAPDDPRGYFGIGGIQANQGDTEAAIESFERAVELSPEDTRARFALGAVYVEAERWEDAIPVLEAAIEAGSVPPIVHVWLGNAYVRTERPDAAIDAYETFLELAPDAPERAEVEEALQRLRGGASDGEDGEGGR